MGRGLFDAKPEPISAFVALFALLLAQGRETWPEELVVSLKPDVHM